MQIGIVATKTGVSVDAIRFYERNGLLPRAPRTSGGFRQYDDRDVETLSFIRRFQSLGFNLREIRDFLDLRCKRSQPCAPVRRRLAEKVTDIERKMEELRGVERELRAALRGCDRELRKNDAHCPILRRQVGGRGRRIES
jgi:MerR family transcriptional regulator, copper efflux regulator